MLKNMNLQFLSVLIVTFMIGFDTTGLGISIPTISHEIGISVKDGSWLSIAYTAGFSAFLLPAGIIIDRYGYIKTIIFSIVVFLATSLFLIKCVTLNEFILFRLLQGISAAFLNTSSMSLLNGLFPAGGKNDRDFAFKKWSQVLGMSFALGPVIGNVLTEYMTWKLIFLINIPLTMLFFVFIFKKNKSTISAGNKKNNTSLKSTIPMVLFLLLVTFFEYVSIEMSIFSLMTILLAMIVIHLKSERSFTRLSELKDPLFLLSLLLPIIFSMSFWCLFIDAPGILKDNFQFSSNEIMLSMIILALPLTIGPFFSKALLSKLDTKCYFLLLSLGLLSLSYQLYSPNVYSYNVICISFLLMGIGASQLNPLMARIVMDRVSPKNSGLAASITSTLRQAGFSLGVAYYTVMTSDGLSVSSNYFNQSKSLLYSSIFPVVAFLICLVIQKNVQKKGI